MQIIYNYVPEKKEQFKKENKISKFIKRIWNSWIIRSFILLIIMSFVIGIVVIPVTRNSLQTVRENRIDYRELVDYAHSNFYSNEYKLIEKSKYMIELFPCGETDNIDRYPINKNERLIKETWYNKNRNKVEHIEYYVLIPKK